MIYYYDSKGTKYLGKIRICDMCDREQLVTKYNLKTRCKLCASKTRKDAISKDELFLSPTYSKYKVRATKLKCDKCGKERVAVKYTKRKTNLCPSCSVSETKKKELTGKFGELNHAYKNGIGTYIQRGRKKNEGKCLICNSSKYVHIHHIDKDRGNNKEENIIPLCASCHKYVHDNLRKGLTHDEAIQAVKNKKTC